MDTIVNIALLAAGLIVIMKALRASGAKRSGYRPGMYADGAHTENARPVSPPSAPRTAPVERRKPRHLDAVMAADFTKKRIMGQKEYYTFRVVEGVVKQADTGHRVFAQTSLGEILGSKDDAAFHAINAKRVDILVIDALGWPVLAVEYNGAGHHRGNAAERDAVKGEALRRAGVALLTVEEGDDEADVRAAVVRKLGLNGKVRPDAHRSGPKVIHSAEA